MNKIKQFLIDNLIDHPTDIVSFTMSEFSITRTTVLRHLHHLINDGKIIKTGTTKQTRYALTNALSQELHFKINERFDEYTIFDTHLKKSIQQYGNNDAFDIAEYSITEILNNAKDHSHGKTINVQFQVTDDQIITTISDDGVGVFNKIQETYNYPDPREVMFELSKGKLTTDRQNHTGEGIFFSSRSCDLFTLTANGFEYQRDNKLNDWSFISCKKRPGTKVQLVIARNTDTILKDIFVKYQNDDSLAFCKTDLAIELSKLLGERLISRSQAKRVTRNLDAFEKVTLDFKNVEAIGQGFVDEIFRVYASKHPKCIFDYINANEDIEYMIQRGKNN